MSTTRRQAVTMVRVCIARPALGRCEKSCLTIRLAGVVMDYAKARAILGAQDWVAELFAAGWGIHSLEIVGQESDA